MALRAADPGRVWGAVDAIGGLVEGYPYRAHRAVRTGRNRQHLGIVALLEIDLRIVSIVGIEGDARHGMQAGWRGRVARADRGGVGGDERAGIVIGEELLARLVGDDARDYALLLGAGIDDLDRRAGNGEVDARIEFL